MILYPQGAKALRQLRIEHQESAGLDFPQACLTEMLFLYDVCKALEFNIFQVQYVMGEVAWKMVTDYINAPVGYPTESAKQWGEAKLVSHSPSLPLL